MIFSSFYPAFVGKLFGTAAVLLTGVISLKLVSEYLTPGQFGLFLVAAQVLAYLPYLDGGMRTVVNRELLSAREEKERLLDFSQAFYSWLGIILLPVGAVVMVLYSLTPNVAQSGVSFTFFLALGVSGAALTFAMAQGSLLIGLSSQATLHWITGASHLFQLGVLYAAFKIGLELWAYPAANLAAFSLVWPLFMLALRRKAPQLKVFNFTLLPDFWRQLRALRSSALHSFLSQICILLLFTIDVVMVGIWLAPEIAVLYALLARVLAILRSFIQTIGEVSWPLLAKNPETSEETSRVLVNVNAWIYGSVSGALAVFLLPFLRWYMGDEWVGSKQLFVVLLARFLITGVQSPAGYFLIASGKFAVLAKVLSRELFAAIILSWLLLRWDGMGVGIGFLASTFFGTFYHIPAAYARAVGRRPLGLLGSIWSRSAAGALGSFLVGWALLPVFPGSYGVLGAAVGVAIGLTAATAFGILRILTRETGGALTLANLAKAV